MNYTPKDGSLYYLGFVKDTDYLPLFTSESTLTFLNSISWFGYHFGYGINITKKLLLKPYIWNNSRIVYFWLISNVVKKKQ